VLYTNHSQLMDFKVHFAKYLLAHLPFLLKVFETLPHIHRLLLRDQRMLPSIYHQTATSRLPILPRIRSYLPGRNSQRTLQQRMCYIFLTRPKIL